MQNKKHEFWIRSALKRGNTELNHHSSKNKLRSNNSRITRGSRVVSLFIAPSWGGWLCVYLIFLNHYTQVLLNCPQHVPYALPSDSSDIRLQPISTCSGTLWCLESTLLWLYCCGLCSLWWWWTQQAWVLMSSLRSVKYPPAIVVTKHTLSCLLMMVFCTTM